MRRGSRLILVLGLLFAVAAAIALLFVLQQPTSPQPISAEPTPIPKRKIVVARIDIPNNTVLTDTETFLSTNEVPETEFRADQHFTSINELQNKVTINAITAAEPIRKPDVIDAGLSLQIPPAQPNQPRPKAIPFQVDNLSGVADLIKPNDFVDVLVSFKVSLTVLRPGVNEQGEIIIREEQVADQQTTKTLLQNVQVLKILKPAQPPAGTPTPGGPSGARQPTEVDESGQRAGTPAPGGPGAANTFTPGQWLLILAMTDQQAEVLKFALDQTAAITLVLRGRGDTANEQTTGATLDLLVSQYGLPLPRPVPPAAISQNQLTPLPTIAPAAPTPTP